MNCTPPFRDVLVFLAALALAGLAARSAGAQTTISLNLSARFESADARVTLADIARVGGSDAERWRGMVVLERVDAQGAVSLPEVRTKLASAGANFGTLVLRGSSCRIELASASPPPAAPRPERTRNGPDYRVIDLSAPPTLRTAIARRLAAMHGVANESIQIAFDAKDALVLDTPHSAQQVVQVHPAASVVSSRVPLRISVFAGDKAVADHRLTADILVLREVLVAAKTIERREEIADADVRTEARWVSPGSVSPPRAAIVGSCARAKIKDGATLSGAEVETPIVIKRGDAVYVQCLSGSIVVQARARALGPGREGETIAFQMEGAEESFTARVAGAGRAVMLAGPTFDAAPVERLSKVPGSAMRAGR